jgi:hypothetical protein
MHQSKFQLLLGLLLLFTACSSEKNTFTNRLYHNTTARYNAYFYANEKMAELEKHIQDNHKEDYSQVLPVFYPVDSAIIEQHEELISEIKQFSSKAIDWHRISKWVDYNYFLIGLADYYDAEFEDAMNTFKYLNVNSKKKEIRHKSLIQLMKAFTDLRQFDDAAYVIDYLSKENGISRENKLFLYKTLAYYYQVRGETNGRVGAMDMALKYAKDKKERSRINFILGQLYQREGLDAMAYSYFKEAQKGNPPYERSFFAQLYAQQVAELNKSKDVDRVRNFFDGLYKDSKNRDLKDVILYEKAIFELKQDQIEEAVALLTRAAQEESINPVQKGYIYKKLGSIAYDTNKDFFSAKFYFDSALTNFKSTDPSYIEINKVKDKLDRYVTHYGTITQNDSIIRLATLNPEQQEAVADAFIKKEEERLLKEASQKEKPKNSGIFDNLLAFGGRGTGASFYFDNPIALQQGTIDFYRNWGNRQLQDNWRRSSQNFQSSGSMSNTIPGTKQNTNSESTEEEKSLFAEIPNKESLLAQIPKTEAEINRLKTDLEFSLFELGKLMFFDFKEAEISIDYLENLITNYPSTPKKAEAFYLLYLANREIGGNASAYVAMLNREFPNSPYTFSVNNPDGVKGNQAFLESSTQYKSAYQQYQDRQYLEARSLIRNTLEAYPLTSVTEKLLLLDVMISGKIDDRERYKSRLENFIQTSEDPDLTKLAKNMLGLVTGPMEANEESQPDEEQNVQADESDIDSLEEVTDDEEQVAPYKENLSQTHIFVIALEPDKAREAKNLLADLETFHTQFFGNSRLRTGNMNLNREHVIFIISPFGNAERAMAYREKFLKDFTNQNLSDQQKQDSFLISIENFQELNRRKDLEEYRSFFKKTYR